MYFVVEVIGYLPHVAILLDEETGIARAFDTEMQALRYAKESCAWDYRVVKF